MADQSGSHTGLYSSPSSQTSGVREISSVPEDGIMSGGGMKGEGGDGASARKTLSELQDADGNCISAEEDQESDKVAQVCADVGSIVYGRARSCPQCLTARSYAHSTCRPLPYTTL